MTVQELIDHLLKHYTPEERQLPLAVNDGLNGIVYLDIKPHAITLEAASLDAQLEPYPDCIMVSVS